MDPRPLCPQSAQRLLRLMSCWMSIRMGKSMQQRMARQQQHAAPQGVLGDAAPESTPLDSMSSEGRNLP